MKVDRLPRWLFRPRSVATLWPSFCPVYPGEAGANLRRIWLLTAVLLRGTAAAGAVEIPAPKALEAQAAVGRETLNVVEPHESKGEHRVEVEYRGFPMNALLDHWFGRDWRSPGAELVFQALDGYRSVITGSQLQRHRAVLAFERADRAAFVVDNPSQHQSRVPLGPYYLVWDNKSDPELQALGTHGWPYQVARIELTNSAGDQALLPQGASEEAKAGFLATKEHCLTCHRIRGVGGGKYPAALERTVCGWTNERLKEFIDDPGRLRPDTSMPAVEVSGDPALRQRTIERIVAYLNAINNADSACSPGSPQR